MKKRKFGRAAKVCVLAVLVAATAVGFSFGNPNLKLKAKYDVNTLKVKYGTVISTDAKDYVDLEGLSSKDKSYVLKNTKIQYTGDKVDGQEYDKVGEYKLTIRYEGEKFKTITVRVLDKVAPEFTKTEDKSVLAGQKDVDYKSMFEATDNIDTPEITVDSSKVDLGTPGDYEVKAVATDKSGNKAKATATVHVQKAAYGVDGTYVYVDLTAQRLFYFKDGQVVFQSPIVSGNLAAGHGTPTGVFTVNNKTRNQKLKGADYVSYVSYWMSFIGGQIGFHDASWRSSFGGTIYKNNGSHGCINMPTSAAAQLYSMLSVGTPVIVKYGGSPYGETQATGASTSSSSSSSDTSDSSQNSSSNSGAGSQPSEPVSDHEASESYS